MLIRACFRRQDFRRLLDIDLANPVLTRGGLQTIVVPFILLFVLYRLMGGLVLHSRQIADAKALTR